MRKSLEIFGAREVLDGALVGLPGKALQSEKRPPVEETEGRLTEGRLTEGRLLFKFFCDCLYMLSARPPPSSFFLE